MAAELTVDATFENGVFVPDQHPGLAEHERVRLIVERHPTAGATGGPGHRIQIPPALANEIALSDALNPEEA